MNPATATSTYCHVIIHKSYAAANERKIYPTLDHETNIFLPVAYVVACAVPGFMGIFSAAPELWLRISS